MSEPVKLQDLQGMMNSDPGAVPNSPHVILNMDVAKYGYKIRDGYSQLVALTDCHSLFGLPNFLLAHADDTGTSKLYRVDLNGSLTALVALPSSEELYYLHIHPEVYISSRSWNGIYDIPSNVVNSWSVAEPVVAPIVSKITGNSPPGKYFFAFCEVSGGKRSGLGPITEIDLAEGESYSISNLGSTQELYVSSEGDPHFYKVDARAALEQPGSNWAFPARDFKSFPYCTHLTDFLGRIWGAKDNLLVFSEAFGYGWWNPSNCFDVEEDILLIAKGAFNEGLYVGTENATWLLRGQDVESIQAIRIGEGVIEGTLSYTYFSELGKGVPVWAGKSTLYAGVQGQLVDLLKAGSKYTPGKSGSSFFRFSNKEPQVGFVFTQPADVGIGDQVTAEVIRANKVLTSTFTPKAESGVRLTDSVSYTVT